jgi:hypothetical protein
MQLTLASQWLSETFLCERLAKKILLHRMLCAFDSRYILMEHGVGAASLIFSE